MVGFISADFLAFKLQDLLHKQSFAEQFLLSATRGRQEEKAIEKYFGTYQTRSTCSKKERRSKCL